MAREAIEVLKCDFCSNEKGVRSFTVTADVDGVVTVALVDLCETHSKPFDKALEKGAKGPRGVVKAPSRRVAHKAEAFEWQPS